MGELVFYLGVCCCSFDCRIYSCSTDESVLVARYKKSSTCTIDFSNIGIGVEYGYF